jgi:hypothetical protein
MCCHASKSHLVWLNGATLLACYLAPAAFADMMSHPAPTPHVTTLLTRTWFGSMVQNGKFSAGMPILEMVLNRVDCAANNVPVQCKVHQP